MRSVFFLRGGAGGRLLGVRGEVESEAESEQGYRYSSSPQGSVEVVDMKTLAVL